MKTDESDATQTARDALLADLIDYFSDPVICAEYMAAGPPDIAEAIRDYIYRRLPTG